MNLLAYSGLAAIFLFTFVNLKFSLLTSHRYLNQLCIII